MSWASAFISRLPDCRCNVTCRHDTLAVMDSTLRLWGKTSPSLSCFCQIFYHRHEKSNSYMLWPWTLAGQGQSSKDDWFVAIMFIWPFSLLDLTLVQREIYNLHWDGGWRNLRPPISFVWGLSCNRAALWKDGECDLYSESSVALAKWPCCQHSLRWDTQLILGGWPEGLLQLINN